MPRLNGPPRVELPRALSVEVDADELVAGAELARAVGVIGAVIAGSDDRDDATVMGLPHTELRRLLRQQR